MKGVLHIIKDDLETVYTVTGAEEFLARYAAFDAFLLKRDQTERAE